MGSWGITTRESDYGLDLLGTIIDRQLKASNFSTFKVADSLEVIKADIMEEIRLANRGCSAAELVIFFSERFPYNFTQGALLIAEFLADYYRTGELVVLRLFDSLHLSLLVSPYWGFPPFRRFSRLRRNRRLCIGIEKALVTVPAPLS